MVYPLNLSMRTKYGYDIIDISGDITYDDFTKIDDLLKDHIKEDTKYIIFNMEKVKYINSSALSLLIKLTHELGMRKINMFVMNVNDEILGLMKMTGVQKFFHFIKNEEILTKKLHLEELEKILDHPIE